MADTVSRKKRSEIMSRIRSKDTGPEKTVRSLLFGMGFRYRLYSKTLPGRPDIYLPKYKAAIFIHGCFWHGHRGCPIFRKLPDTNTEFWRSKIARNKARDRTAVKSLQKEGWRVCCLWECALKRKGRIAEPVLARTLSAWIKGQKEFLEIKGNRS